MRGPLPQAASDVLNADLARLANEHLVVLHLDDLDNLLSEPAGDPFTPRGGPCRAGIDDLALTLAAADQLPEDLTVRIVLPLGRSPVVSTADAQAALRRQALDSSSEVWRAAMAVRNMGRRQLPIGMLVAMISWVVSAGAGYLVTVVDNFAAQVLLAALAMTSVTIAWMLSWMVIETFMLDWRQPARQALAFDLIARATLEVVLDETPTTPSP